MPRWRVDRDSRVRCFCRELSTPSESQRIVASQLMVFGVPLSPGQPASFRCSVFFLKCFFFYVFGIVFKAFLCISQKKRGEFENGIKTFWKKYMSKTFYKKVEGENTFFLSFFPFDLFMSHFWLFLCKRSPKTPHEK
jgi:hypothetical protein